MLKKLLCASFIAAATLSASADYMNVDFTYADENYSTWGKSKNENYDVAIAINNPAFAGKKITKVTALVAMSDGIEDISLWLSKELTLVNKVNTPDIASMPANIERVSITPSLNGYRISATLPEPYVITADPVYVGYSFTVTNSEAAGAATPVIVTETTNPEGFYVHCSKSVIKWKSLVETAQVNACIYVTIEGELDPYCVGIISLPETYVAKNTSFTVPTTVCNAGSEVINEIDYTYTVDGTSRTGKVTLDKPLAPDVMGSSVVPLTFEGVATPGPFDMNVTIDRLNGQQNAAQAPTGVCMLNVMPFMPVKRPVVEDVSGTQYGYAPRCYIALNLLNEEFGDDVVLASYHISDEMQINYNFPFEVNGIPDCTLDRTTKCDTYHGTYRLDDDFGMRLNIQALREEIALGEINLGAYWNDAKTDIVVSSDTRFVRSWNDAYYEVAYVLLANGLHGEGELWNQRNNFSGDAYYANTGLRQAYEWPKVVPGLIFDYIVVDNDPFMGIENSLPSVINMGESYHNDYTFTKANESDLINSASELYVAAFILDKFTGRIMNANKVLVAPDKESSVQSLSADAYPVETLWYDLSGRCVAAPSAGMFIKAVKMSDGSVVTSKVALR